MLEGGRLGGISTFLVWLIAAGLALAAGHVLALGVRERRPRLAALGGGLFLLLLIAWLAAIFLMPGLHLQMSIAFLAVAATILLILLLTCGRKPEPVPPPRERVDERGIMFARARYQPGNGRYEAFYGEFPDLKEIDDSLRAMPGLGEPGGVSFDPLNAAVMGAQFDWIERVSETVDGPVQTERVEMSADIAAARLKGFALRLGAVSAGTTAVNPAHVYSRIGRGLGEWGAAIDADRHPFALVFAVEMESEMVAAAPLQPVVAESSRQYVEAAKIALVIAEYLRLLGHPARAHIDGNYRLVLPQLAADAGLGEVGRLSLLITPQYGPRVRLGAVTTTLELPQDEPVSFGVKDFCDVCLKCARNCPPAALPKGGEEELRGTRYWRMAPEKCYRYWRRIGTDCGLCIAVCPYSHPRGLMHSFVRAACRRSAVSRRVFAWADDVIYGRMPRSTRYPAWMLAGIDGEVRRRLKLQG